MNDGISAPGTPVKNFQTPSRPLSQQQFRSLKEKAAKQSPSLYKFKVLSDPTKKSGLGSSEIAKQSAQKTVPESDSSLFERSVFSGRREKSSDGGLIGHLSKDRSRLENNIKQHIPPKAKVLLSKVSLKSHEQPRTSLQAESSSSSDLLPDEAPPTGNETTKWDGSEGHLTDFENPALAVFTSRMVNKELEMRRLLTNIVLALIWNLISKFVLLFFQYTKKGAQLRDEIHRLVLKYVVYKIYPQAHVQSIWFQLLSWQCITSVFHLIVLYNIGVCLWNLLVKAQNLDMSDLNLTEHQKRLLGIIDDHATTANSTAPATGERLSNNKPTGKNVHNTFVNDADSKAGHKPFIFKSLQTPTKMREEQYSSRNEIGGQNHVSFSVQPKKVNAFGVQSVDATSMTPMRSLPSIRSQRQEIRPGYIPSNRYTYMMDSPSSTRKL